MMAAAFGEAGEIDIRARLNHHAAERHKKSGRPVRSGLVSGPEDPLGRKATE
jgi:hypothetical protein